MINNSILVHTETFGNAYSQTGNSLYKQGEIWQGTTGGNMGGNHRGKYGREPQGDIWWGTTGGNMAGNLVEESIIIPVYSLDLSAFNLVHGSDHSVQQGSGTPGLEQYILYVTYRCIFSTHSM